MAGIERAHSSIFPNFHVDIPMPASVKAPRLGVDEFAAAVASLPRFTETDGSQWVRAEELDELIARNMR